MDAYAVIVRNTQTGRQHTFTMHGVNVAEIQDRASKTIGEDDMIVDILRELVIEMPL